MNRKEHQLRREILRKIIERIDNDPALKAYYLGMEAGELLQEGQISERGWQLAEAGPELTLNFEEVAAVGVKIQWSLGAGPRQPKKL